MLSIDEINQLQAHNGGLQTQNNQLQKERNILLKALELSITDFSIEASGKELTEVQMKGEIEDYKQQAELALKEQ